MVLCVLFRPSFCANCGDKIERSEWGLFTSRRFCEVCESEYKAHDLLPRLVVGLGLFAGLFGLGSFLKGGSSSTGGEANKQSRKLADTSAVKVQTPVPNSEAPLNGRLYSDERAAKPTEVRPAEQRPANQPVAPPQQLMERAVSQEAVYMCGAETKKGTPCSRRVKGNVRCFQHTGMPAMLPGDKLRISQ